MWQAFRDWYTQPFRTDMSVGGWFAFFGLILALSLAWGLVFRTIREVA